MKIPEFFEYDKRMVDRLIRSRQTSKSKVNEFIEKTKDVSENVETIPFNELIPQKKEKGEQ